MRNEVIFDDRGRPDILVVFTPDELKLPDTLKGRKVKEYAISKYPNTMIDGMPYSLPFMPPAVNVNHDEAIRLCEAKGPGWHLITNDEWAALARQSWENDTVPTGNTNSGKSHSHPEQKGTTYQNSYGKTLAGSGPIGWNHDRTAEGVADMVGNVWEHVGGVRFLNGQVQIIPNNEAAAGADQSPDSKEWTAIYTPDGDPVYYNVKDGEIVSLIRKYLKSGIMMDDEYKESVIGFAQGGNLSPLLSNIMLNELDKELEARIHQQSENAMLKKEEVISSVISELF